MSIRSTSWIGLLLLIPACASPAPPPLSTTRLVDLYEAEPGENPAPTVAQARTEWRFDAAAAKPVSGAPGATHGWEAGPMVKGLAVREGRLTAETTGDFPLLHVERTEMPEGRDNLHAIEVRLSVTSGSNLSVEFRGGDKPDLKAIAEDGRAFAWMTTTPLVADGKLHT